VSREIPANHSPHFAPEEAPTLLTATRPGGGGAGLPGRGAPGRIENDDDNDDERTGSASEAASTVSASSSAWRTSAGSAAATKAPAKMAVAKEGEEVGLAGTAEWSHPLKFSQVERSEELSLRPLGELRGSRGTANGPLAPAAQA
jgi:hypothetical protein